MFNALYALTILLFVPVSELKFFCIFWFITNSAIAKASITKQTIKNAMPTIKIIIPANPPTASAPVPFCMLVTNFAAEKIIVSAKIVKALNKTISTMCIIFPNFVIFSKFSILNLFCLM